MTAIIIVVIYFIINGKLWTMERRLLLFHVILIFILFPSQQAYTQVNCDSIYHEGTVYSTIQIDTLCWMNENLNVGQVIEGNVAQSDNGIIEKYCYQNVAANCDDHGGLYQWNEILNHTSTSTMTKGLCPEGWHVANTSDWANLLGNYSAGAFDSIVTGGLSGIDLSLTGYGNGNNYFSFKGVRGFYWGVTTTSLPYRLVLATSPSIEPTESYFAYAARCVKNSLSEVIPFGFTLSKVDASCNGSSDGFIDLAISGTVNPTIQWSNGATNEDLTNISAGLYIVTVTSATLSLVDSIVVGEPTAINITISETASISCFNGDDGQLSVLVSGGQPGYSYSWSSGSTNSSINDLTAGSYTITVADQNGCTAVQSAGINNPADLINIQSIVNNVACNGDSDGSIVLTLPSGNFQTFWSHFSLNQNQYNLVANSYSVKITDLSGSLGCEIAEFVITEPDPIIISGIVTDVPANTTSGGSVDVSISGGTIPHAFIWSDGSTNEDLSNVTAGTYTLTVTDLNSCTAISSAYVINQLGVVVESVNTVDVACNGGSNGQISFSPKSGGMYFFGMSYFLSTGQTSSGFFAYFQNLSAGSYSLTVTDINGDSAVVENILITEPNALLINNISETDGCSGKNIDVSVSGGSGSYSISLDNITFVPGTQLSELASGNYTVYIKDAGNCLVSSSYTVTALQTLSVSEVISNVTCFGADDGSIQLTVNNGATPYLYQWSNGSSAQNLTGLSGGNYIITVTDNNGCFALNNYSIIQPSEIILNLTGDHITYPAGNNGNLFITANGGVSPYNYTWSNGVNVQNQIGLTAGIYNVTVTDFTGCTKSAGITLIENIQNINISLTGTDVLCNGGATGSVFVNVSGGNQPYSYAWPSGASSQNLTGLAAGTYTVTVTGFFGMSATDQIIISEPTQLSISLLSISSYNGYEVSCATCSDGSIVLLGSGGVSPYQYDWSNGSTFAMLNNLAAGQYGFTLSDDNGCLVVNNYVFDAPAPLAVTASSVSSYNGYTISCQGAVDGIIEASVNGGVTPYTYLWNTNATSQQLNNLSPGYYQVTVTDANLAAAFSDINIFEPLVLGGNLIPSNVTYPNGSNGAIYLTPSGGVSPYNYSWSNGAGSKNNNNLVAGTYTVTIVDSNGCIFSNQAIVTEEFIPLTLTINASNLLCNGAANGSAQAIVTGGSAPYQYSWSNGANGASVQSIVAGSYTVTVTDYYGITTTGITFITEPAVITLNLTVSTSYNGFGTSCASCADGAVITQVVGGVSPYTFGWSHGTGVQNPTGMSGGLYTVTVSDNYGCVSTEDILITAPDQFVASISSLADYNGYHVSCNGASDAQLSVNVNGGVSPYTYQWSNSSITPNISGLDAGLYVVSVVDANSTLITAQFIATEPPVLQLQIFETDNECFGSANGVVSVQASGGISPYTYLWDNSSNLNSITNLTSGFYNITVFDAQQCQMIGQGEVDEPAQILISSSVVDVACNGDINGVIDISVSGGTPPFSYQWSNGSSVEDLGTIPAGTYTVTVIDGNCTAESVITVNEPADMLLALNSINISFYGASDGSVDLEVYGGVSPYAYNWSTGSVSQDITNLAVGSYTVTVHDANFCTKTSTANIDQPDGIYSIPSIIDASCAGENDGAVDLTIFGGVTPYNILWSNYSTSAQASGLLAGVYIVTVTDQLNDIYVDTFIVNEPDELDFTMLVSDATCNGGNDGEIELIVAGGTSPYTYMWNNGANTRINVGLEAGGYMAYVIDNNDCAKLNGTSLGEPDPFISNVEMIHASGFGLMDGSAVVSVVGSTPPYSFFWSTGATGDSIGGLAAGLYQLLIFDANGCDNWVSFEILDDPSQIVFGCTDPLAFNYDPNANMNDGSCYYIGDFPDWNYNITGNNHLVLLSDTIEISLDGVSIETGDVVGVFFDNNGQLSCAGYQIWEGATTAITAWGDDQQTANLDGFVLGESMKWKIYDVSEQIEYEAIPEYNLSFLDSGSYVNNGLSGLASLTAITFETQQIMLPVGWSIMSTYIDPFEPLFNDLMAAVDTNMKILKNSLGQSYWPEYGLNQIGNISIGEGYQVKMEVTDSVNIVGLSVAPEEIQIAIPYGWSILGYLRKEPAAIDILLYPIVNSVDIVKNGDGNIYWPAYGVNSILNMIPGFGYQVRTNSATTLTYPANYIAIPLNGSKSVGAELHLPSTGNNMTLGIPINSWDNIPDYNTVIQVHSLSGILVGQSVFDGADMAITLWGDDQLSDLKDGLMDGEHFIVNTLDQNNKRVALNFNYWITGDAGYESNKISIVGSLYESDINESYYLSQNIPNPSKQATQIGFCLAANERVILSLYDTRGRKIKVLLDADMNKGIHSIDVNVSNLPAGVYMYKLLTRHFSQTKYLTVVK
jgi:uncharacterized protein (TIGR02145 family)